MKKLILGILTFILLFSPNIVRAANDDFHIESNMQLKYEKGTKYLTVEIEYVREVLNNDYYFPASGNKLFPIPDLSSQTEEQIEVEREFKRGSIAVKDSSGKDLKYSVEEGDEGITVVVPNYKQTTKNSPYRIFLTYKTHDYIDVVNQNIVIQAPALSSDTEFEIVDTDTNTRTSIEYGLEIYVDKESPELSKIWPTTYTVNEGEEFDVYNFKDTDRIAKNPYLEFGTSQIYRFELEYTTPRTDNLIPERYSKLFNALSTNIFEISLPRYFDETGQVIKIESISPTPTKIGRDSEGNIIATFEVDANKEGVISVVGYAWVEKESFEEKRDIPNPSLEEYLENIKNNDLLKKYLNSTIYWQVSDPYIQEEANKLKEGKTNLMDLIKADYQYINEKLEYDQSKADSLNDRIGAKQALQGDAAVCMEYADAMISILRAQGIASRAAIGYSNLKDASETKSSQVRHQWVQVWVPDYGWLSIDPTWESENMDIGPNINRLLWETFSADEFSNTKIFSADTLENINNIEFNISVYAVEENDIDDLDSLKNYEEIVPVEEIEEDENWGEWLNKFIKASSVGKSVAIVIPIFLAIMLLIFVITIIKAIIRNIKLKKQNSN